jgi:hypothetical protein
MRYRKLNSYMFIRWGETDGLVFTIHHMARTWSALERRTELIGRQRNPGVRFRAELTCVECMLSVIS